MKKYLLLVLLFNVMFSPLFSEESNLIKDGNFKEAVINKKMKLNKYWSTHAWVHIAKYENKNKITALCSCSIKDGVVTLKTPKEISAYLNEKQKTLISNKIYQTFDIPASNNERKIVYNFDLKGYYDEIYKGYSFVFSKFYKTNTNGKNVQVGKIIQKRIKFSSDDFTKITSDAIVPPEATKVEMMISFYGVGEWQIKNVTAKFEDK